MPLLVCYSLMLVSRDKHGLVGYEGFFNKMACDVRLDCQLL